MDFIGAIFTGIFVALLIGFALSFGLALFVVLGLLALMTAFIIYAQVIWRRWQITRAGGETVEIIIENEKGASAKRPTVIDVEYQDVTDKK